MKKKYRQPHKNEMYLAMMMKWYGLNSKDVGKIIKRSPVTVRQYMCGKRHITDELVSTLLKHCRQHYSAVTDLFTDVGYERKVNN